MSEPGPIDDGRPPWMVAGRLRTVRDGLSVAQVAIAVAAVALAGGVAPLSLGLLVVLCVLALWRPLPVRPSAATERGWTLLVFVALAATVARAVLRAEFLDAGVDFLLLLVVQRLFNRQRAREHSQLLLLGILLMVVGAVINTELSYPLLLVGYLLVAVMALLVNTLMSEGERLGSRVMMGLGRHGHRRQRALWRAAAMVAGLAAAGALLTFLFFPRFGPGVFLRGRMATDSSSGFSDEVQLGGFGTIKTDTTVVIRIRPDIEPGTNRPTWHLRGSSFDRYENGHWRHGPNAAPRPLRAGYGYRAIADGKQGRLVRASGRRLHAREVPGFARSADVQRGTMLVEDIGADVLFVPSPPVAIQVLARGDLERRARPIGGRNDEIRVSKSPGPIQYRAVWRAAEPTRDELRATGDPTVAPEIAHFVQRPSLSPEVTELAERIAGSAPDRLSKIEALADYLQGFEYTLEQRSSPRVEDGADPIEGFLFDTRAGHCEYFATALALLGRELGIPTRIVNGYYGAHRNDVGGYYAVRQADAHSWVEVHFGELGWVTFDPTPPAGRTAGDNAPWWPAATEVLDALRNAYLEYVIDYDLSKQRAVLEGLGVRRRDAPPQLRDLWWVLALVTVVGGLWMWRRIARRRRSEPRIETRWLHRVLDRLARDGFTVAPSDSPTALQERLRDTEHPAAEPVSAFLRAYEALRFGRDPSPAARKQLERRARAALTALSQTKARRGRGRT